MYRPRGQLPVLALKLVGRVCKAAWLASSASTVCGGRSVCRYIFSYDAIGPWNACSGRNAASVRAKKALDTLGGGRIAPLSCGTNNALTCIFNVGKFTARTIAADSIVAAAGGWRLVRGNDSMHLKS